MSEKTSPARTSFEAWASSAAIKLPLNRFEWDDGNNYVDPRTAWAWACWRHLCSGDLEVIAWLNHRAMMEPFLDFAASAGTTRSDPLVRLSDAQARIADLQAQVEQLRTEAKVASDRIQELGRFTKAQRGEIEGLRAVRVALDRLVAHIGMDGEIDANHPAVHEALNALNAIDSARAVREDGNGR